MDQQENIILGGLRGTVLILGTAILLIDGFPAYIEIYVKILWNLIACSLLGWLAVDIHRSGRPSQSIFLQRYLICLALPEGAVAALWVASTSTDIDRNIYAQFTVICSYSCWIVAAAISEEIIFRGLLHQWLSRYLPYTLAIPIGAAIFAISHLTPQLPWLFMVGLITASLRVVSNSLAPSIALHIAMNFDSKILYDCVNRLNIQMPTDFSSMTTKALAASAVTMFYFFIASLAYLYLLRKAKLHDAIELFSGSNARLDR